MTTVDASRILDVATGYMASQQLFESSRIGLFRALADGPRPAQEIAEHLGVSERIVRILADAMSARGLLRRMGGEYQLERDAAAFLAGGGGEVDLAPFLTFLSEISYSHWIQFPHTVDTGEPGDLGMDDARWATFMSGVMTYNALHAREFGRLVDVSSAQRALDFGGLAAGFAIEAMRRNPDLTTTFLYASDFEDGVRRAVDDAGLTDRSEVRSGDTATTRPAGTYDLIFANHVIHRFSEAENRGIFRNLRGAATVGAKLTLLDFFLDEDETPRALDAQHAGEYLVIDGTVVYPESQVRDWLAATGWRVTDRITLPGSPRVLVAEAV